MPVQILDSSPGPYRRDSEYFDYSLKETERPTGVEEIDGYRTRASQTDHQSVRVYKVPCQVMMQFEEWVMGYSYSYLLNEAENAKVFAPATPMTPPTDPDFGPDGRFTAVSSGDIFKTRQANKIMPVERWDDASGDFELEGGTTWQGPDEGSTDAGADWSPPKVAVLRRVLPLQDPRRPWLFAAECDLVEGRGAVVADPHNYSVNNRGEVTIGPDGEKQTLDAITWVDNSEAGYAGDFVQEPTGEQDEDGEDILETLEIEPSLKYRDGYAIYRVTFRPREYTLIPDYLLADLEGGELNRYVQRNEEFGMEALPMARIAGNSVAPLQFTEGPDGTGGTFTIKGQTIPEPGVKHLPTLTLTYTWVDVPDRPLAAYAWCVGKVNSEPFDGLNGAPLYPKETLLCLPWRTKRTIGITGRVTWQIQYRFAFRPQGWNHFPGPDGRFYRGAFARSGDADDLDLAASLSSRWVYDTTPFSRLFEVPPPVLYTFRLPS